MVPGRDGVHPILADGGVEGLRHPEIVRDAREGLGKFVGADADEGGLFLQHRRVTLPPGVALGFWVGNIASGDRSAQRTLRLAPRP